jgi:hypothetical protein
MPFVGPEGLLQHSENSTSCPCPEPDQSSSCPHTEVLKIRFNTALEYEQRKC